VRILILTQYYPPETGAPQNRLSDLARRLTIVGHDVTVLTALPNYPRGEIFTEYQGRFLVEERSEGVKIVRTWIYATQKKTFVRRLLNYFSFVVSSLVLGLWKIRSQDVVIVESPPLFLGISGFLISLCKSAKLILNVSDLWPDSAVAMGILSNKSLIRLSRWLEEFLYKRAALITGQTQGIVDNIRLRFADKPVALITNGVDVRTFVPASDSNEISRIKTEFGFGDKFVIGYAGLHGLAQGLETVIQAAGLLSAQENMLFVFFGDGPEKEKLMQLADELMLTNIRFYPSQMLSVMPAILRSFDLALVPLKKLDLFKGALPSKMFEAMAAEVPIIASIEGEARELVERAQAGIAIQPESPEAMASAIVQLYQDREQLTRFGRNGRRYVVEHFDRQKIAEYFERLLKQQCRSEIATA
jgi:glycosyltransferase involved in cell wall biosynthesis